MYWIVWHNVQLAEHVYENQSECSEKILSNCILKFSFFFNMFKKSCFFKKLSFVLVLNMFIFFIFHVQTHINREIRRYRFKNCLTFGLTFFLRKVMLVQSRGTKMYHLVLKGLKDTRIQKWESRIPLKGTRVPLKGTRDWHILKNNENFWIENLVRKSMFWVFSEHQKTASYRFL